MTLDDYLGRLCRPTQFCTDPPRTSRPLNGRHRRARNLGVDAAGRWSILRQPYPNEGSK
ncbi:MAG: hypothetical protein R3C68_13900 [Myxococcota bacterium]